MTFSSCIHSLVTTHKRIASLLIMKLCKVYNNNNKKILNFPTKSDRMNKDLYQITKYFVNMVDSGNGNETLPVLSAILQNLEEDSGFPEEYFKLDFVLSLIQVIKNSTTQELIDICMKIIVRYLIREDFHRNALRASNFIDYGRKYYRERGLSCLPDYVLFISYFSIDSSQFAKETIKSGEIKLFFDNLKNCTDKDVIESILEIPSFVTTVSVSYNDAHYLFDLLIPYLQVFKDDESILLGIFKSLTFLIGNCKLLKSEAKEKVLDIALPILHNKNISSLLFNQVLWFLQEVIENDFKLKKNLITCEFCDKMLHNMMKYKPNYVDTKWSHILEIIRESDSAVQAFVNSKLFSNMKNVLEECPPNVYNDILFLYAHLLGSYNNQVFDACIAEETCIKELKSYLRNYSPDKKEDYGIILRDMLNAVKLSNTIGRTDTFLHTRSFLSIILMHKENNAANEIIEEIEKFEIIEDDSEEDEDSY